MKQHQSPYKCHLFICIKSRDGKRKSCGDTGSPDLKAALKDEIKSRGWKSIARVSESSCLGVCDAGPNIMIYPQGLWLTQVKPSDMPEILITIEQLLKE